MANDTVTLTLSRDEALVFFEWLAGFDSDARAPADESAERKVLWKMEGQLEKSMVEPLAPNYRQLVEDAKMRVSSAT